MIVIDSREQRPLSFPNCETVVKKLDYGDYSLLNYESIIVIERKSLSDWINTILHEKKRFRAELRALQAFQYAAVIIEADIQTILAHQYSSDINPDSLIGLLIQWQIDFSPVHFILAGDRPKAAMLTQKILCQAEEVIKRYGTINKFYSGISSESTNQTETLTAGTAEVRLCDGELSEQPGNAGIEDTDGRDEAA